MQQSRSRSRMSRFGRGGLISVTLVVAAAGLAACGSKTEGAATDGSGGVDQAMLTKFNSELDGLYQGTFQEPPADAPAPPKDKLVYLISCGQAIESCSVPIKGMEDAAKDLGWKTKVIDTNFDNAAAGAAIRQAIAVKADAIGLFAIDCSGIKQPLAEAAKAGIVTVAAQSLDCDADGGQPLFDHVVSYANGDFPTWVAGIGGEQATWLVSKTRGKAKTIVFTDDTLAVVKLTTDGFVKKFDECSSCKVVDTVKFTGADLGPKLQQMARQAILQHPEADSIVVPYDGVITMGVGAAVQASGRKADLKVVGDEGFAPNMDLIRKGTQEDAGTGAPSRWDGFSTIDSMIRIFDGQPAVGSGIGYQVYDKDHNMPPSGAYVPPVDFESAYLKSWGVQ